jgi:hypothetical protein
LVLASEQMPPDVMLHIDPAIRGFALPRHFERKVAK